MKVLSLFDGISCGRVALERSGHSVKRYFAYEIEPNAIKISKKNYPDNIACGNVINADYTKHAGVDLILAGFPCQDLSINKRNREGLKGKRSGLFWELVRAIEEVKPKYFLIENNYKMPDEDLKTISETLGVSPILINSGIVSAQQRMRLYWTNIPNVTLPKDKNIVLLDILENTEKENLINETKFNDKIFVTEKQNKPLRIGTIGKGGQGERVYSIYGKTVTLTANGGGRGAKTGLYYINNAVRKLTPLEAERAQTLPDNYTKVDGISDSERLKCIGNGWTVDIIAHILSFIPRQYEAEK